jgi:hypothetical protein
MPDLGSTAFDQSGLGGTSKVSIYCHLGIREELFFHTNH